jgi:hypothetical protein
MQVEAMRTPPRPNPPEHLRDCGFDLVESLGTDNDIMKGARRTDPEMVPDVGTRSTSR